METLSVYKRKCIQDPTYKERRAEICRRWREKRLKEQPDDFREKDRARTQRYRDKKRFINLIESGDEVCSSGELPYVEILVNDDIGCIAARLTDIQPDFLTSLVQTARKISRLQLDDGMTFREALACRRMTKTVMSVLFYIAFRVVNPNSPNEHDFRFKLTQMLGIRTETAMKAVKESLALLKAHSYGDFKRLIDVHSKLDGVCGKCR